MTTSCNRRALLCRTAAFTVAPLLGLAACGERGAERPAFKAIDVTGADYAKDFSLADPSGKLRSLADFRGKVVVLFFGYTQCPDVCPTSMAELAEVRRQLAAQGDKLQGVFVTVDPQRDTPEVLKGYMESFDPSFVALRPTPEQLPELAKQFKVYFKKVDGKTPTSYTMDHTAGSYIYDTQGRVRLYTRYGSGADALASDVRILLQQTGA